MEFYYAHHQILCVCVTPKRLEYELSNSFSLRVFTDEQILKLLLRPGRYLNNYEALKLQDFNDFGLSLSHVNQVV